MAPRGKGNIEPTPPPPAPIPPPTHVASSSNHDFSLQFIMQTERSVGELKTGLEAVAKSNEKHDDKIDALNETVHSAKGFLKAITIIGSVLGAIGITLLTFILNTLSKHFAGH